MANEVRGGLSWVIHGKKTKEGNETGSLVELDQNGSPLGKIESDLWVASHEYICCFH